MNRHHARPLSVMVLSTLILPAGHALAQEGAPPQASAAEQAAMAAYAKAGTPGAEHRTLAAMAGDYDLTVKSWYGPGEPAIDTGTATRRMILGDRVLVEEVSAKMMGQPFNGQGLHGFDNVTGKYWSTWNDSMSTGLMVSEGSCDAKGACTYHGRHNDALSKQPMATRMTTRWADPSTEVFEMYGPGPDGKEAKMMEITYRKRGN